MEERFAEQWWKFRNAKYDWEDRLGHMLSADYGKEWDFDDISTDEYDCSLEIQKVSPHVRLSEAVQRLIWEAGFGRVYVNHSDGWQTHYNWSQDKPPPARGWRRRYVSDPAASTTNVIAGEPNPGYYEISYWPEGWSGPGTKDWLATGYMRIVPDPLDPYAATAPPHA
jgi:hypothetical protein